MILLLSMPTGPAFAADVMSRARLIGMPIGALMVQSGLNRDFLRGVLSGERSPRLRSCRAILATLEGAELAELAA